jgi:hypothetical protein
MTRTTSYPTALFYEDLELLLARLGKLLALFCSAAHVSAQTRRFSWRIVEWVFAFQVSATSRGISYLREAIFIPIFHPIWWRQRAKAIKITKHG